jgi:hypothetical protein
LVVRAASIAGVAIAAAALMVRDVAAHAGSGSGGRRSGGRSTGTSAASANSGVVMCDRLAVVAGLGAVSPAFLLSSSLRDTRVHVLWLRCNIGA